MNTGQTRVRRAAGDLDSARASASTRTWTHRRRGGVVHDVAPEEAAALSFLAELLVGDQTWSVGEVRHLLELRARGGMGIPG